MRCVWMLAVAFVFGLTATAQEPKKPADPAKPAEPKPAEPKKDEPKVDLTKKGQLPMNWKLLGLTDVQTTKVYTVQAKYNTEIDDLEAKIKELKEKMSKERLEVLTAEQKKRLEEIFKEKSGTGDKPKDK